MRVDKGLIVRTLGENYSKGEVLLDDIFYEIDTKENKDINFIINVNSKYHDWLDGLEYIQPLDFEDAELGVITKVKASEMMEITQSPYSLLDRIQMYYKIKGLIVLNNPELKNFINAALKEYNKIEKYEEKRSEINKKRSEINKKIDEVEKIKIENIYLQRKKTLIAEKIKEIKKDLESKDKKTRLKAMKENEELNSSFEKVVKELEKNTELLNLLETKIKDLRFLVNENRPLLYNLFSKYTPFYNLLTKYKIVAINDSNDLIILDVSKKESNGGLSISDFEDFIESLQKAKKSDEEIKKIILEQWEKVGPIEFKFKLNSVSSKLKEEIWFFDIEEDQLFKNQLEILAPVKPTIAAAMLASGSTGAFSHEIPIEDERCLIKTVISPVTKVSKEISRQTGDETTVTIKTWEPRLGIFNKTRKSFKILTQ